MANIFTATQQVVVTFEPEDVKQNPTTIDNVPQWATSDPNIMSVEPSDDGMSMVGKCGRTGKAQVSVTFDARKGPSVKMITLVGDIEVIPGDAFGSRLIFAAPTEQA